MDTWPVTAIRSAPSSGLGPVEALAVADEPEPFWNGDQEPKLVAAWAADHFPRSAPMPWEPRIPSPDVDCGLVVWTNPDGPRGRLDLNGGGPSAAEVVERLAGFVRRELAGDGDDADMLRRRGAEDVVLSISCHDGQHSLGHGPLDAPDDHPRTTVRGLRVAALALLEG